jgi:hypothetical protein
MGGNPVSLSIEEIYIAEIYQTLISAKKSVRIITDNVGNNLLDYSNLPDFLLITATCKTTSSLEEVVFQLPYSLIERLGNTLLFEIRGFDGLEVCR